MVMIIVVAVGIVACRRSVSFADQSNEDEDQSCWLCGYCKNNHQRRYNDDKGMIQQDIDPTLRQFNQQTK